MTISVTCTKCGAHFSAPDSAVGMHGHCPKCNSPLDVPIAPDDSAAQAMETLDNPIEDELSTAAATPVEAVEIPESSPPTDSARTPDALHRELVTHTKMLDQIAKALTAHTTLLDETRKNANYIAYMIAIFLAIFLIGLVLSICGGILMIMGIVGASA